MYAFLFSGVTRVENIYSDIIELYRYEISCILTDKRNFYRIFYIPSHSGKRRICEPLGELKAIHSSLLNNIFYPKSYLLHKCAYAYIPGSKLSDCAVQHTGKKIVMKADIKDFFGSVTFKHVKDSLMYAMRMDEKTADTIARLCTLNNSLPQGAATSPFLSNLVCRKLDRRLYTYTSERGISYTRYADDLIFSGDFDTNQLMRYLKWALSEYYCFRLNYEKLKIMPAHKRQTALGLLLNDHCRLTKEKRAELRQLCYYIKKFGAEDALARSGKTTASLRGYICFAQQFCNEPCLNELSMLLDDYYNTLRKEIYELE